MSMLSAQCDELRQTAESVGLAMPQAATLMMEAADTIWELRGSVHRERDEAYRLREENQSIGLAAYELGRKSMAGENAKLRELVDGLRYCAHEAHGMCARVPVGGERPFMCCPLYDFDGKEYRCEKLMRELGMEVDR